MSRAKILILEDDPFSVQLLRYNLKNYDAELLPVATTAREAFAILDKDHPDLALLDIFINGEPVGIDVAAEINRRYDIPIIYLSGYSSADVVDRAKQTEPFGYLLKPYTPRELSVTLDMALYKHEMGRHLRESRATLSATLESLSDAVLATDGKFQILYANPVAREWFKDVEKTSAKELLERLLPQDISVDELLDAQVPQSGRVIRIDVAGAQRWVEVVCRREKEASGRVIVLRDLTNYMQAQENFRQSQKIEAVGQLAGGVAHDFNNLLSVINSYADLLQMKLPEQDKLYGYAQNIRTAGMRAAELVSKLLSFSRKGDLHPTLLDVKALTLDALKMFRRLIREDIELVPDFGEGLGTIWADGLQLEQVLMNLCVNARDAIDGAGKITIKWRSTELSNDLSQAWKVAPGRYLAVSVSDTGCGIPEEIRARLFEPYFTTKGEGKGTGLGLAIVFSIVRDLKGHIEVDSTPGEGTTFTLYFPACDKKPESVEAPKLEAPVVDGHETVLVVEDDESIADCLQSVLETHGYTVICAGSSDEALQKCQSLKSAPSLLISDVILPGMSGEDLAMRLKSQYAEMKVLFMTGYDNALEMLKKFPYRALVLQKPFSVVSILPRIRSVLNDTEKSPKIEFLK